MEWDVEKIETRLLGWWRAFRRRPIRTSILAVVAIGWVLGMVWLCAKVAGCGTGEQPPAPVEPLFEHDEHGNIMPRDPDKTPDTLILSPTWISADGGHPICDGAGMVKLHEYEQTRFELGTTLPGAKWDGKNPDWVIAQGGGSYRFSWRSDRFVVHVLAVESNRAQVSVFKLNDK